MGDQMNHFLKMTAVALIALGACGQGTEAPAEQAKLEAIPFLIDWEPEPTYLGIYYAKHLGLFEREGFDVTIVPNLGANRVIPLVANGANPIGTASGGATVIGAGNGNQTVSLAVVYQKIPTVIYGPASTGIKTPADLQGKRIAIYPTSITKDEFNVFMTANGIDPATVNVIDAVGSDLEMLAQGQADGVLNYIEMSPSRMDTSDRWPEVDGEKSYKIRLSEAGVGGYGLNIITSPKEMAARPERMRALSNAALEGYTKGCAAPEDAVESFLKANFVTEARMAENRAYVQLSWSRVCEMIGDAPGSQTEAGWQETLDTYQSTGKITNAVDVRSLLPQ